MSGFAIGPFVLSFPRLFVLAGVVAMFLAGRRLRRRHGLDLERPLWLMLLAGLLSARLAYVVTHLPYFAPQPWTALYLWQDGYAAWGGVLGAMVTGHWLARRGGYAPRALWLPLFVGFTVWAVLSWTADALLRATDQSLPALTLADIDQRAVDLEAFLGRPVVVNLWATWCPPCRREMPVLAEAQQHRPDVTFLFVNQREDRAAVRRYLDAEQLALEHVLLDLRGEVAHHFGARGMPTTLFFDHSGKLVHSHLGEVSAARLADYLRSVAGR